MFLLNSCLGLFSAANLHWRPFSRSYGAILPSSLTMLLPSALGFSPCPPVSVSGTGAYNAIAAFPGIRSTFFPTLISVHITPYALNGGFSSRPAPVLVPVFSLPDYASLMRPRSSDYMQYRNFHLLSIGYASRPRLRPRLTQGRSALPWKPRTSGLEDSHLHLATHSGILSSRCSTAPSGTASALAAMLLYRSCSNMIPRLRCRVSAPDIFGAGPLGQ